MQLVRPPHLMRAGNYGSGAFVVGTPTWTDNADGTATVTFTTNIACYAGVDYGTSAGTYTKSSFDYSGAGPALESATSHTVQIPDPIAGGTEAAATYYYRIWMSPASYSAEYTGVITIPQPFENALPGGSYLNQTGIRQFALPGGRFLDERTQ